MNRDDDGVSNSICCRLCNHLSLTDESTDRYYEARQYSGDDIPIKDVPDRARAIMIEDGWTEADIEAEVESFVAVSSILEIGRTRGLAE